MQFVVLDLTFDVVLGLPWLTAVNPRLNWADRTLAVQQKGCWVRLPTIANMTAIQGAQTNCKCSGGSDVAVQGSDVGVEEAWDRARAVHASSRVGLAFEDCVEACGKALEAGHAVKALHCANRNCNAALCSVEPPEGCLQFCAACGHTQVIPNVACNPLGVLRPSL